MSDIKQEVMEKLRPQLKELEVHYLAIYLALGLEEPAALAALSELFKTAVLKVAQARIPDMIKDQRKQSMC